MVQSSLQGELDQLNEGLQRRADVAAARGILDLLQVQQLFTSVRINAPTTTPMPLTCTHSLPTSHGSSRARRECPSQRCRPVVPRSLPAGNPLLLTLSFIRSSHTCTDSVLSCHAWLNHHGKFPSATPGALGLFPILSCLTLPTLPVCLGTCNFN